MKVCNKCGEEKPLSEYHKHRNSHKGACKVCRNKQNRSWNKEASYKRVRTPKPWEKSAGKSARVKARRLLYKKKLRNATPNWVRRNHLDELQYLVNLRDEAIMLTGDPYHLDHIVPINHPDICGLHVPWNLRVVPAKENLSKGNFFEVNY